LLCSIGPYYQDVVQIISVKNLEHPGARQAACFMLGRLRQGFSCAFGGCLARLDLP